ncbi:hypothetical protein CcI49_13410 [Frankia sp. CcI49]|uniref:AMP-binding protein n=1 Tax=Frankia sp. CcI49 TaxID=1745382 RepID=UPI000977C7B2|nr:AMP-binding protein [Frankia sp. CcI49]ONH59752.1 hypothetical protein CcI49_13410 [Frankia sp. CcI49]
MNAAPPSRVRLTGPALPAGGLSLAEAVRPFGVATRGITFLDGGDDRRYSYDELAGLAAAVAVRLRSHGVRPGSRVAMTISNDLESVLTAMGVWAAGAAVVSVPPASRRAVPWYARHFGDLLRATGCELVVAGHDDDQANPIDGLGLASLSRSRLCADLTALPGSDVAIDGTALIQFTSGSVSAPKGVAVESRTLAGHLAAVAASLGFDPETDRVVSWLPLYHDMGLLAMFMTALATRTDLVLMPPTRFATGPARWLTTLGRLGGTVTAAPNFAYRMAAAVPYEEGLDLSRVRVSLSGGERVNWQTLTAFHEAVGPLGFSWGAIMPSYGLAEGVVGTTTARLGRGPIQGPGGRVCVGRPLPGVVLEAPDGPPGGPVELGGSWVYEGYHTVDGFRPAPSDGWFDTGDDGFVHDGELYVLGRRNEVVAVAGRNVFAEDIEMIVLDAQADGVKACAAFRLKDADQDFGLMVEVPVRPRRSPEEVAVLGAQVRSAVSSTLGVRLKTVLLVRPGTIPRTTSGKVQRAECRELHAEGGLKRRLLTAVH